ncbi:MAG: Gfo/Idh/MocA family oxidoreductase [Bacillota bacterium]|nr:Gfo/Idh/MocA family oxidoreductase [Bacillota bacterium]
MKIGTVGSGPIVSEFIEAAKLVKGVETAAVFSRDGARAAALAERHSVKKSYSDKNSFLNDGDFDFVYIALPNSLHFEWAQDAMLAGKNVICEKPFVSTADELTRLIKTARERQLFLFEASIVRHLPNYRLVRRSLDRLGEIKFAQANFSQYSSRYNAFIEGRNPNVFSPEFSGGALMDLNCYNLNFLLGLFGAPENIEYTPNMAENGIDTSGVLVLKYNGMTAVAVAAKDSGSKSFVQIQGTRGYIYVHGESGLCRSFTVFTKTGEETFDVQGSKPVMTYEISDFEEIFRSRDFERRDALLNDSLRTAVWLEKARRGAGIRFASD